MTVAEMAAALQDRLPKNQSLRGLVQAVNEIVEDIRRKQKSWSFWFKQESITLLDEYTTGTVTVTNASTTVTGSGTTFTSDFVGRLIRVADGEYYTIATYVSATEITLDVAYAGATASGQTYSVTGDCRNLPSDCMSVTGVWDATNQRWLRGMNATDMQTARIIQSPGGQFPTMYTLYSYGPITGLPRIVFYPPPTEAALLYLWYYRRPTAVTGPGSTPDLPSHLHNLVLLGVLWKYTRSQEDFAIYRAALNEAIGEDRTIIRDQVDNVSGADIGGFEDALREWTRGQVATGY